VTDSFSKQEAQNQ